jgi:hypothetical protein
VIWHVTASWPCAVVLTGALGAGGCAAPPKAEPPRAFDAALAREAQSNRLARLQTIRSGGVIELEWSDDRGDHFEQGDLTLLIGLPNDLALHVRKQVSDPFVWLGSNADRFWYFDLLDRDAKKLYVGEHADLSNGDRVPGALHPLRLIDLAGLSPWPDEGELVFDDALDAWALPTTGRGGPMRVFLDATGMLPVRIQSLAEDGAVLYESVLSRYEPVAVDGLPRGAYPRVAHRMEVTDIGAGGRATVMLDGVTTRVDTNQLRSVTDLARLTASLRPHEVIHLGEERPTPDSDGSG